MFKIYGSMQILLCIECLHSFTVSPFVNLFGSVFHFIMVWKHKHILRAYREFKLKHSLRPQQKCNKMKENIYICFLPHPPALPFCWFSFKRIAF